MIKMIKMMGIITFCMRVISPAAVVKVAPHLVAEAVAMVTVVVVQTQDVAEDTIIIIINMKVEITKMLKDIIDQSPKDINMVNSNINISNMMNLSTSPAVAHHLVAEAVPEVDLLVILTTTILIDQNTSKIIRTIIINQNREMTVHSTKAVNANMFLKIDSMIIKTKMLIKS